MGGHVATAFRAGRGFLVGDAAHRTTPVGGTGMNTAIHAAHNLGWKLAWVLRGWAGEALLDSYEAERRPIGTENVQRSLRQGPQPAADGLSWDTGVRYTSAVIDGPGERAPHAWLCRRGSRISSIDLFDGRLTLLTGRGGQPWRSAAAEVVVAGLPLRTITVGRDGLHDVQGMFADRYGLGDTGAALIRPDGYEAWRGGEPADARDLLRFAIDTALGRRVRPELAQAC